MPSITSRSSQGRISSRTVPSFSSSSVQNSSWARSLSSRSPFSRSSSSSSSAVLLGSLGSFSGSAAVGTLLSGSAMDVQRGEKETMQGLNHRLALYLEQVRSLESGNRDLEVRIQELLEERKPVHRDIKPMLAEAHVLNQQIQDLTLNNAAIMLQMDNARLSAEDFRMKLETEASLRQTVESDIDRLRRVKEEYDINAFTLRNEGETLTEELLFLKKNHQEELNDLRSQLKNEQVTVEVESEQGPNLFAVLASIRKEYADLVEKNKKDAENWYQSQVENITTEVTQTNTALDIAKGELNSKRQAMQSLEMELEIIQKQNMGLENILSDTEQRYGVDINKQQIIISKLEADLLNIRNEMMQQKENYDALLKAKMTLDAELSEYRRLLTGEMRTKVVPAPPPRPPTPPPEITTRKIVKVITTTLVDGKVVGESSEVEEFSEQKQK
ncbi:keratin, type I cytoskeletal 18-A [Heterodontus francisci]|uniref:keratin, type I cytoskeletal 18-A n=1 Tax=Heterodontus francisci TaxID=7792 RepID=UPI00355C18F3